MSGGGFPSTSAKNRRSSDSIREASCLDVLANPNASEASPRPVSPASVRNRIISQTVRSVARTGDSSNPGTRTRGIAFSFAVALGSGKSKPTDPAPTLHTNERRSIDPPASIVHVRRRGAKASLHRGFQSSAAVELVDSPLKAVVHGERLAVGKGKELH